MIDRARGTKRVVWLCLRGGTKQVWLLEFGNGLSEEATVSLKSLSGRGWSGKPAMRALLTDLFETDSEALDEYRRRKMVRTMQV